MATLIFILMLLAVYHFVYESIIAPSLRLGLRYQFFNLRDQIRMLKAENGANFPKDVFYLMEEFINSSLKHLHHYNFSLLLEAKKEFESDPKLKEKINKKINTINSCKIGEVKDIFKQTLQLTTRAFLINIGSWFIYLIPLAILYLAFSKLKNILLNITFTPEYKIENLIHDNSLAVS